MRAVACLAQERLGLALVSDARQARPDEVGTAQCGAARALGPAHAARAAPGRESRDGPPDWSSPQSWMPIPMQRAVDTTAAALWGVPGASTAPRPRARAVTARRGGGRALAILHELAGLSARARHGARRDADRPARGRGPASCAARRPAPSGPPSALEQPAGVAGSVSGRSLPIDSRRHSAGSGRNGVDGACASCSMPVVMATSRQRATSERRPRRSSRRAGRRRHRDPRSTRAATSGSERGRLPVTRHAR